MRSRRSLLRLLALLLLLPLGACGDGGDGGEDALDDFYLNPAYTGTPVSPLPPNGMVVQLTLYNHTTDTVTLAVRAEGVLDLYNLSFDLVYDSSVLSFQSASLDPFFGGSSTASVLAAENPAGHLVTGLTRLGAVGGVTGTGNLAYLTFLEKRSGSTPLSFDPARPLRGDNSQGTQILGPANFFGGTLSIQ